MINYDNSCTRRHTIQDFWNKQKLSTANKTEPEIELYTKFSYNLVEHNGENN